MSVLWRLNQNSVLDEILIKKSFSYFLYEDCKWETRYLYTCKYSLTKNWLKNVYIFLLKCALIEDCFRFFSWRPSIFFVIVDNISWLSSWNTDLLIKSLHQIFSSNFKVFYASLTASCCFDSLDIAMLNYVSFQNDVRIAFHFKTKQ